ncbi:MAG: phage integrase SAM-like domain-containing protein [Puia sp.]|nr:phage integrase SAM-like domain-containing protein [Puia sp.]
MEIIIGGAPETTETITGAADFSWVVQQFYYQVRDGQRISARGRPYAKNGHTRFQQLYNWVQKFAEARGETPLSDITDAWVKDFLLFLYDHPLTLNTVSGLINNIHAIVNALIGDGLPLKALQFRVWGEGADTVYNSEEELRIIRKAKYSHKTLKLTRDVFLIQSYLGVRLGTLKRFLRDPLHFLFKEHGKWYIRIKTNKTGAFVVIPVKSFIYKILKKRKFTFERPYYEHYYSGLIKVMAKEAGLTQKHAYSKTIGGKTVEFVSPKCDLMSSHTARRNFATNSFLAGVPMDQIMLITGHKTREAFLRYLRADSLANAYAVSRLKFFK